MSTCVQVTLTAVSYATSCGKNRWSRRASAGRSHPLIWTRTAALKETEAKVRGRQEKASSSSLRELNWTQSRWKSHCNLKSCLSMVRGTMMIFFSLFSTKFRNQSLVFVFQKSFFFTNRIHKHLAFEFCLSLQGTTVNSLRVALYLKRSP